MPNFSLINSYTLTKKTPMTDTAVHLTFNIAAIAIYLAASGHLISRTRRQLGSARTWLLPTTAVALLCHAAGGYGSLFTNAGLNLGFFEVGSLIFWVINLLVLISGLRKPLHNLFIFLFPLSALALISSLIVPSSSALFTNITPGIAGHILLSILAYSLLIIATLQAVLLAYQNHQLKHKHPSGVVKLLPPLQTMEALLFELLWLGEILLTLAIATGALFVDDLMAQHLAHKTVFSVLAWLIYGTLLCGRHFLGWRGNSAIRWSLGGFSALMLAYFGSKFVLEFLI